MGEFGEGGEAVEAKAAEYKLPAEYDHRGDKFKSPDVDDHVFDVLGRLDERRTKAKLADLLPVVRTELREIENQRKKLTEDTLNQFAINEQFDKGKASIQEVEKALVDISAGSKDRTDEEVQRLLNAYIDRHINRLGGIYQNAEAEHDKAADGSAEKESSQTAAHTAQRNREFFQDIRQEVTSNENELRAVEENAPVSPEEPLEMRETADEHPEMEYNPKEAARVLDTLKGKAEVTFEDVEQFIQAEGADIPSNSVELSQAVESAKQFYETHKNDKKRARNILVTVTADGKFKSGWQNRIFKRRAADNKRFVFDPTTGYGDAMSLKRQDLLANRYMKWHKDIDLANSGVAKLKAKGEITDDERLAITRSFEQFANAETAKNDEKIDEARMAYLEKMLLFIKNEIGPNGGNREDYQLAT